MTHSKFTKPSAAAVSAPIPHNVFQDAFDKYLPEMLALPADELLPVNVDIPTAVTIALGALPVLQGMRDQVLLLPKFQIETYDKVEGYTLATAHAHAIHMAGIASPEAIARLNDEATQLRQTLMLDAAALARRGLLEGQRVGEFKGLIGYKNVAFELLGLSTLVRAAWPTLENKTALQLSELDRAGELANELLVAVGEKAQNSTSTAQSTLRRLQAFTLFANAYEQARRAAIYLRWDEGDVDELVPSLYAGRSTGGRKSKPEVSTTGATTTPTSAAPAAQPSATSAAHADPASWSASSNGSTPGHAAAPGMPGSNPFAG